MKNFTSLFLVAALLVLPVAAHAGSTPVAGKVAAAGMCPIAGDMDALQKDVDSLALEVNGITDKVADSATKQSLQKVEDHISTINARLKKMHDEMDNAGSGVMASVKTDVAKPDADKKH